MASACGAKGNVPVSTAPGRFARHLATLDLQTRTYDDDDVDQALRDPGLDALPALLSPAATARVEELAQAARALTLQRFGRAVRLFAPLYVSNACLSSCTYCGFSKGLDVTRRTLTLDEVEVEAKTLTAQGFRHLLLVS
ncbi:MAG: 2-iminoacetate synthase, partial [Actinomycetota bacterium]|nr:2-iminoacetate synthase [Actinomycetota bacterium]